MLNVARKRQPRTTTTRTRTINGKRFASCSGYRMGVSVAPKEKGDWLRSAAQVPVPVFLLHQPSAASGAPAGRQEIAEDVSPRETPPNRESSEAATGAPDRRPDERRLR